MINKELPDISVSDFAMDILRDMQKDPLALRPALKESTLGSSDAPDITKIKVSDDFVSLVLEGKKPIVPKPILVKESVEVRMKSLVARLSTILAETRQFISELGTTTVGNIGTNNLSNKKSKRIYNPSCNGGISETHNLLPNTHKGNHDNPQKSRATIYDSITDALRKGYMGQIFSTKESDRLYVITKQKWGTDDEQIINGRSAKGFTPGNIPSKFSDIKKYSIATMIRHSGGKKKSKK